MVQLSLFVVALAAVCANGAPLTKRIAQVIAESTAQWEKACVRFFQSFGRPSAYSEKKPHATI